ncbi:hypothetical protein H0H92_005073 [Tricholoma furcatifolium]|nr:hypothetical protein H0H92_005073 [Tricholoma furcatifolium]
MEGDLWTRPVMEVFPALETLVCRSHEDVLYPSVAFLHSGVQRWILDVGPGGYIFEPTFEFGKMHNLAHLELGDCISVSNLFHIFTALEVLPLETISLPPFRATYTVLASFSRWKALREINSNRDLESGHSRCWKDHVSYLFGVDAFPSLIALTISGCPYDLSILLDDENFPYHIHSLAVQHMPCTDDPVPTYQKIVAKCPAVTKFVLHDSDADSYSPFTSLRPFLSLKLTRLVVKPCNPLSYDATEIEELVRSLPFIEELDLGTEASALDAPLGTFTFDYLLLFSTHCPRLTRLGIHLDVSKECNPSPPNLVPFSALRELDLAGSFLFDNVHDVNRAAILLSKILPPHCRCICQPRGWLDSEPGETFRRTLFKLRGHHPIVLMPLHVPIIKPWSTASRKLFVCPLALFHHEVERFAMSASHVLGTPELLFQILSYSNKAAVVKGLQVSQFWFAVGKPIIWGALSSERDLWHLLVILIPYDRRRTAFDPPSDKKWERFLQYSTRVRYLCIDVANGSRHMRSVLQFLTESRPVIEIFPAVKTLRCLARRVHYLSFAFLHSGVQRWILKFGVWDDALAKRVQFGQMHNLTHVDLGPELSADDLLRIFAALEGLSLEAISLPPYKSTYAVLASLSRFQSESLREIRSVPTYQKIVAKCPAVTEFVLHDADASSHLAFRSLRPFLSSRLTRLVVTPYNPLSYDTIDIEELARSLPLIEDLDLGTRAIVYGKPMGTFTLDHLLPFSTHCPRLTRLGMVLDVSKDPVAACRENLKFESSITMPTRTIANARSNIFAVPLEELMGYDGEKGGVPRVVKDSIRYLRENGA